MAIHKNIRLLELFTILTSASFVIAVIVPYYRDQMGLSFQDFLIAEAAFAATTVLLEVPTGWISDVWKRKYVLALGAFFDLLGYALLLVGDSLFWAIAGQVVIGIGISLISGTNLALLYDTLLSSGETEKYRKLEGKRLGLSLYSIGGASIIGGFLYPLHHQLPLVLCLLTCFSAIVMAVMMTEPERHKKRPEKYPLRDMWDTARYALKGHGDIGFLILFAAALFCGTKLIMWSQQPYYLALGVPEYFFGILMAVGFTLGGASSHASHLLDGKIKGHKALALFWAMAFIVSVGSALHIGWLGVSLLMIGGSCIFGMASPRVSEAINSRIGSERRATILSTLQLMVSLMFIPASSAVGWLSDHYTITGALLGISAWLGFAGFCLAGLFFMRNKKS